MLALSHDGDIQGEPRFGLHKSINLKQSTSKGLSSIAVYESCSRVLGRLCLVCANIFPRSTTDCQLRDIIPCSAHLVGHIVKTSMNLAKHIL
jgi:hypothetical protein